MKVHQAESELRIKLSELYQKGADLESISGSSTSSNLIWKKKINHMKVHQAESELRIKLSELYQKGADLESICNHT